MGKDEKVARQFSVEKKEFASVREDKYDQERFEGSLIAVRELLGYFEEECSGDEALRETLTIACEGVFRQFHALERKCVKEKNKASRNTGGDDGREKQAS